MPNLSDSYRGDRRPLAGGDALYLTPQTFDGPSVLTVRSRVHFRSRLRRAVRWSLFSRCCVSCPGSCASKKCHSEFASQDSKPVSHCSAFFLCSHAPIPRGSADRERWNVISRSTVLQTFAPCGSNLETMKSASPLQTQNVCTSLLFFRCFDDFFENFVVSALKLET